jgi:hypothetical protein
MSAEETEIRPDRRIMPSNPGFMQVDTLDSAIRCAEFIAKSSFCPKGMVGKPGDVVVAMQMGQELGLKPLQALQNIAVINGRPSLWGDAMLAVARQSPDFEYIKEEYLKDSKTYICRVKRKFEPEFEQSFSEADAKLAGLWGKQGPWAQYPRRMLQMRARGFCLRDAYPDLLRGIITCEEAEDMPKDKVRRKDYSKTTGNTFEGKIISEDLLISDDELSILKALIEDTKIDSQEDDLLHYLKIDCLEMMPESKWEGVCKLLKMKISKRKKAEELDTNKILHETEMTPLAKEFFEVEE